MSFRKGMAGLILLVLVLGYMMAITTSSTMIIQTESSGKLARQGYKNAYYAAVAGIGTVMARLRKEPASTFASNKINRPYFSIGPDGVNRYCNWTSSDQTFTTYTNRFDPGWISASATIAILAANSVDLNNYMFRISTYPGNELLASGAYYIKSQGRYIDNAGGKEFTAQVWARMQINDSAKLIALQDFGTMGVQNLTSLAGTEINDFWDWQDDFQ